MGLVSMSDVYRHLNLDESDLAPMAELQGFIDAATPFVEYITGPMLPTTVTETYPVVVGQTQIMLRTCPVLSIQTVTEYLATVARTLTNQPRGSSTDNYGYSLDIASAGLLVRRGVVGVAIPFLGDTVVVSYTAGRATVPAHVRMAALEDIRGLWQQTQQGGNPRFGGDRAAEDGWTVGPIHLFPRLAALLEGTTRVQSIA
ncbi:hypothetical protein [Nocardia sp. NPDC046763]|uniref:hypothetical protein n=1 Tax=Nocardia sp. NPDC046763 TaxID=3155256 RepID=UPI0033EC2008